MRGPSIAEASPSVGYEIRPAVPADLASTARLHARLLPVGLFPALGQRFLERWHRAYHRLPYSVVLVAVDPTARGRGVVGFLLGTTDQASHTAALLANRRLLAGLALTGALALLRRPRLAVRFLRTRAGAWARRLFRRSRPGPRSVGPDHHVPVAVLAAIAVHPRARRHDVGARLVSHFLDQAEAGPAGVAELVTRDGPDGAATFYERLGWRPRGQRVTRDGTTVRTYVHPLGGGAVASPGLGSRREYGGDVMAERSRHAWLLAALLAVFVTVVVTVVAQRGGAPETPAAAGSPSGVTAPPEAEPSAPTERAPVGEASDLPATVEWRPGPGEPQPEVKRAASAFIETAGTWSGGDGAVASLQAAGIPPAVASTASALEAPDAVASSVRVIYPQYGGILPDRAAVMTLFDQNLRLADGSMTTRQLALDVRLTRPPGGTWEVEKINPLTSLGPRIPLSATARAVLESPGLELSAPARLDVSTGRMSEALLQVLLALSQDRVLTVQVMHTGHIQTVYPTDRISNHAVGRAVDIRAVDGLPVVDPATPRDLLTDVMTRAGQLGATEVGGPFDLNGDRPGFFTDAVHQDHLHIGITPGKPQASV